MVQSLLFLLCVLSLQSVNALGVSFVSRHFVRRVIGSSSVAALLLSGSAAQAFGPANVELDILGYKQVELCNGQKPIMPGQKAMGEKQ